MFKALPVAREAFDVVLMASCAPQGVCAATMEVRKRVAVNQIPGTLVLYDDGSVERFPSPVPLLPASSEFVNGVATKDACINTCKGTWARIFLPDSVAHRGKAPLVLHFHGGGMCLGNPAEPMYHNFCSRMASSSSSIWISVAYRLAPEHRLPAQYQDCFEALCWLRSHFTTTKQPAEQIDASGIPTSVSCLGRRVPWEIERNNSTADEREPWLIQHGDAARVFCTGESAGATILHFVALHMVKQEWSPLHIRGLMFVDLGIMTDPLPEMKPSTDPAVTTEMMATSVGFCLPEGVKLGDPLLDCLHLNSKHLFEVPWPPVLMLLAEKDLLRDGGMDYFESLKHAQKVVELHESQGKGHCFHLHDFDSETAQCRERRMVEFMKKFSL